MFESWGYRIIDAEELKNTIEKQAKLAYSVGDYALGKLNDYGQRINVIIELKRKNKEGSITFRSGWMIYPNGRIVLTTPYGAK